MFNPRAPALSKVAGCRQYCSLNGGMPTLPRWPFGGRLPHSSRWRRRVQTNQYPRPNRLDSTHFWQYCTPFNQAVSVQLGGCFPPRPVLNPDSMYPTATASGNARSPRKRRGPAGSVQRRLQRILPIALLGATAGLGQNHITTTLDVALAAGAGMG